MKTLYGSLVWFIATLFVIYSFCLNTAAAVFSHAIIVSLHATSIQVSYAVSAFVVGFAVMQIPAGYLLDRFNVRYVLSAGVLCLAIGNVLISYADTLVLFSISNFIQGLGASFAFIAAGVVISKWFSAKSFPILFGLTQTLSCILAGIIHYVFTQALLTHPWNMLYKQLSIFGFILFGLTLVFVTVPKSDKPAAPVSLGAALKTVCGNPQVWLSTIAAATSFGVLLAYASFWYMNVQKFYLVSANDAFIMSAIMFTGIGIGTPVLGYISNLFKSRIAVIHVTLALGCMALLLGIYLPHFQVPNYYLTDSISFLIGFMLSGAMLFYTIVSEISSDSTRGVALSVTNTGVFLFNTLLMFAPYVFMTELSKNFFTYLWILPFCVVFSIMMTNFVKDSFKSE